METLTLYRIFSHSIGTPGMLVLAGQVFFTLELPWLDNAPNISCIPAGKYLCRYASHRVTMNGARLPKTYEVHNVENRSGIIFHAGNLISETQGCILLGSAVGFYRKLRLFDSKDAFYRFIRILRGAEAFELNIKWSDYSP